MTNLKNSGATQLTLNGGEVTDWKVTLEGKELYTLPASFTIQDTFYVRRVIEKMMQLSYDEGSEDTEKRKDKEVEQLLKTGNSQLDALKDENLRIATAFEKHMLSRQTY